MHFCISDLLQKQKINLKDLHHVGLSVSGFNAEDPEVVKFFEKLNYPCVKASHDTDGPAVAF